MSFSNLPDYKARYFEYKELTKVHGTPNLDSIVQVYTQLKRNAHCVPTTLGGGQLGYLALVISNTAYAAISGAAAFIRPTDPGSFSLTPHPTPCPTRAVPHPVAPVLTAADIAQQKATWDERRRM